MPSIFICRLRLEDGHMYNESNSERFRLQDLVGVSLLWLQLCPRVFLHPGEDAGAVQTSINLSPILHCSLHFDAHTQLNVRIDLTTPTRNEQLRAVLWTSTCTACLEHPTPGGPWPELGGLPRRHTWGWGLLEKPQGQHWRVTRVRLVSRPQLRRCPTHVTR